MYMELTPQDTVKDLQRLLIHAIPGFEFPRKDLFDYVIQVDEIPEDEVGDNDFVLGFAWNEMVEEEESEDKEQEAPYFVLIENSLFNEDLSSEEIEILAILMMNGWLQRQITSIENIRMKYSGTDFKMTSQANHLSKLQSLLSECQRQSHHLQRLYKRREFNEDGKYQSTWYWFGQNGTTNV